MIQKICVIYIIKNVFCLCVCSNPRPTSISQPISNLSTSTDSPSTGAVVKTILEAIGAQTKKFQHKFIFKLTNVCLSVPYVCLSVPHVCLSVPYVCLSVPYVLSLVILQLLYLPPPKGEQKAAGGGLLASIPKYTLKTVHTYGYYMNLSRLLSIAFITLEKIDGKNACYEHQGAPT